MTLPHAEKLVAELRRRAAKLLQPHPHCNYTSKCMQEAAALIEFQRATIERVERELAAKKAECEVWRVEAEDLKALDGHAEWVRLDALLSEEYEKTEALEARLTALEAALRRLVDARALSGVREIVAGWNGEGRPDGPYPRHDARLGAQLPKTNCGAIYELDEAMTAARASLSSTEKTDEN